jgi:hypothetical protein
MLSHFLSVRPAPETYETPLVEDDANTPIVEEPSPSPDAQPIFNRSLLTALFATIFIVSSLFLLAPQGLGAWLASLPAYLSGWTTAPTVPAGRLLLALGVYQLFAIPFALIAIIRGWWNGSQRIIRLSIWMIVALLLALFYPARQPGDLVWTLIPLWALAAFELSRHIRILPEDRLETAGVIVFTILLLAFAWVDFNAMYYTPFPSPQANTRLYLFLGTIILLLASLTLVGYGWSVTIARTGAAWGAAIVLGIYTLGAAWGATGLRNPLAAEMWNASPRIAQADLLAQTADEVSEWATSDPHNLPVLVQGIDSPAVLWALRFHDPQLVTALEPASAPALIVTPVQQNPQLAASYRGQDFAWRQYPAWEMLDYFNTLRWLTYRELPTASESILLWARNDLFIDSQP